MKTIVNRLLLLVFAGAATTAVAQTTTAQTAPIAVTNAATYQPKAGDVLTYHVTTPTAQYDFTVTLKTYRPDLAFDWAMTGDVNQKGAIAFNNADAADAMVLNNFFSPGAVTLQGKTSVWLSNKAFKLIKSNINTSLTFDNSAVADAMKNTGAVNINYDFNGVKTASSCLVAKNTAGTKEFWVLDNAQNPLITYMNMGWTIQLTSIKQQ